MLGMEVEVHGQKRLKLDKLDFYIILHLYLLKFVCNFHKPDEQFSILVEIEK